MPLVAVETRAADHGEMLVALAAAEGSASHPYTHSIELNADPLSTRNLADLLHLLSTLYGRQPGLIEIAATRNVAAQADLWFNQAVAGFAAERDYLADLIVAAGPTPSTPGEADTATAIQAQRHALEMIATSDRFGCALGGAVALVLDWQSIRAVMDTAADRLGIKVPPYSMPDEAPTSAVLTSLADQPRLDRTLAFGARQLLLQHRGLWDLLETRAAARAAILD